MARIHMLSLLSIIMVVMAATVDVTPDRTKRVDRKPSSRLIEAHNHGVEAQSETSLSTVIATGTNTARRVLPDSPTDKRCRGGEHTKGGYESSQVSCPFACQQEVTGNLQNGQVAALVEGLWLNRGVGPVAVPEGCEGLEVVIPNVQSVDVESKVLRATVEGGSNHGKTLSQELQRNPLHKFSGRGTVPAMWGDQGSRRPEEGSCTPAAGCRRRNAHCSVEPWSNFSSRDAASRNQLPSRDEVRGM